MNDYTTPSGFKSWFANEYNQAGLAYSTAAFAELAGAAAEYGGGAINESTYTIAAENNRTKASEIQLAAAESANALRRSYLESIGNAVYSAAARGAAINGGGNLRDNLERSSMNLGDDISKLNRNANRQAKAMRTQANIYDKIGAAYAKNSKLIAGSRLLSGIGSLGMGLAMFNAGMPNYNTGAAYGLESTVGLGGVPMYGGSIG